MNVPKRLPADITRVTPAQLLAALGRAWRAVFAGEPKPESILVLLAQWSLETGDGLGMHAFNIGNIKSREGDGHDYCYFACFEFNNGLKTWYRPDDPTTRFRAFETLDSGAIDYLQTLSHRFASAWPAVLAGDPEGFARALKLARYYTADEHAYALGLRARVERFKRLVPLPPPEPLNREIAEEDSRTVFIEPDDAYPPKRS